MKTRIVNYTFDKANDKITFDDFAAIDLGAVLLITNATDQIIIYNFADTALGGTVSGNELTLEYDCAAMADADKLLIYYDIPDRTHTLTTGLDQDYDDTPAGDTSAEVWCWPYRWCTVGFDLDSTLAPTDIVVAVEVTQDGANWHKLMDGFLGDWRYDDTSCATVITECMTFPINAYKVRVTLTATGVDADNYFTVGNSYIALRN